MADRDYETVETGGNPEQDALGLELEAALAKYASVEPRAGLEERILANLQAEQTRADRPSWRWGLAAAVAAVFVVAIAVAWRSGRPSRPVIASRPSVTIQGPKEPATSASNLAGILVRPEGHGAKQRAIVHRSQPEVVTAADHKLDQFPSPQPLSEQETILMNYVAKYPEHAVLVARAVSEALRRDQLEEMKAFASGVQAPDSEEPNNDTTER